MLEGITYLQTPETPVWFGRLGKISNGCPPEHDRCPNAVPHIVAASADLVRMERFQAEIARVRRQLSERALLVRQGARRNSWWPVSIGIAFVLAVGLMLYFLATNAQAVRFGEILTAVGILAAFGLCIQVAMGTQARSRDLQAQINTGGPLDSSDFTSVDLTSAYLRNRSMNSVRFAHARCRQADFTGAHLHDAVFTRADLRRARLNAVEGSEIRCYRADLRDASFIGATLTDGKFEEADLRNVDLTDADLCGADLRHADLRGADLSSAQLTGVRFTGAVYDEQTRWPETMSSSQLEARGLDLTTSGKSGTIKRQGVLVPVTAMAAVLGLALFSAGIGGAFSSDTPTIDNPGSPQVLGASSTNVGVEVFGEGMASITIETAAGTERIEQWLPYSGSIAVSDGQAVTVTAEQVVGSGSIGCELLSGADLLTSDSATGSFVQATCSATAP